VRRKLRRLASSSRNARATVQGSDGRLPVILHLRRPSRAAYVPPGACVPCRVQNTCAGARLAELLGELAICQNDCVLQIAGC
jgi:hypothetical protein